MALENPLDQYIVETFGGNDGALDWIQAEAERQELPKISIRPDEGLLLHLLARSVSPSRIVEIGTLAGYSGVWLARALPANGQLFTLEMNPKHAALARQSFEQAGVADKVTLMEGPALESLNQLEGEYDFVFIDANKSGYADYLHWAIAHVRVGGMIAAHNALRGGRVTAPESDDDKAMAVFNQALAAEKTLASTIIAVGDGMAIGVRIS